MERDYEIKYHRISEDYWWFIGRRDIVLRLAANENKKLKILDVGCSGGELIEDLINNKFSEVVGIDLSKDAVKLCRKNKLKKVFIMNGAKTKFKDNEFDIVIASDVLEHIKDEKKALDEWKRILNPNGRLIVFVPAFNFLWSEHDEINRHCKRYSRKELVEALGKSNFRIERSSYWNFAAFFPVFAVRMLQKLVKRKKSRSDQLYEFPGSLNKLMAYWLKFENSILEFMDYPLGVSVFAVARKH